MTNKEKAREIGNLCPSCLDDGINGCSECERAGRYIGALQMAQWKDQQFKEYLEKKLVDIRKENSCGPHGVGYNQGKQGIINKIINEFFKED